MKVYTSLKSLIFLLICLGTASCANAQSANAARNADGGHPRLILFQSAPDGPQNICCIASVGPQTPFVPFTVTAPAILSGVVMPIAGKDLIIQLATGPAVPPSGKVVYIPVPKVVVSKLLPGTTSGGPNHTPIDIPIEGDYKLVPGQQYFLILSASKLSYGAGSWLADSRANARQGMFFNDTWSVSRDESSLSLVVYGRPAN